MEPSEQQHSKRYVLTLSLAALGVVYGDIGTSPLYAFRECFAPEHNLAPSPGNILGVLSLIFWSLVLIISIEYLIFVMRVFVVRRREARHVVQPQPQQRRPRDDRDEPRAFGAG